MCRASYYAPTDTSPGSATISRTWTTTSPAGSASPPPDRDGIPTELVLRADALVGELQVVLPGAALPRHGALGVEPAAVAGDGEDHALGEPRLVAVPRRPAGAHLGGVAAGDVPFVEVDHREGAGGVV